MSEFLVLEVVSRFHSRTRYFKEFASRIENGKEVERAEFTDRVEFAYRHRHIKPDMDEFEVKNNITTIVSIIDRIKDDGYQTILKNVSLSATITEYNDEKISDFRREKLLRSFSKEEVALLGLEHMIAQLDLTQ